MPDGLGAPDGVTVSPDRRLVSMGWSAGEDGVVRLDQFDADLDFSVLKTTPDVFFATVDGNDALWFVEPHAWSCWSPTAPGGQSRPASRATRWSGRRRHDPRLEGDLTQERAIEIAESSVPVG